MKQLSSLVTMTVLLGAPACLAADSDTSPGKARGGEREPLCESRAATKGVINGKGVNLRRQPDFTSPIVHVLKQDTRVEVLERQERCLLINLPNGALLGQWVRVTVAGGEGTLSGWVFDSYIRY